MRVRAGRGLAARAVGVASGLVLDHLLGEPPAPVHPVALFGRGMSFVEGRCWADRRAPGALFLTTGAGAALLAGSLASALLGRAGGTAAATALAAAGTSLREAAGGVWDRLSSGDLDGARALLPALVGRDTAGIDEKEIARAVVESVAENLSDAVVGTALWGLLLGAPGAMVHRAVNTLDAMVGHRSARYRRFGWAAARADDLLGWPSARLTALLVMVAAPRQARAIVAAVRRDAPAHPSPNASVAEAAFAGALGLRLGGVNRYGGRAELRPFLGCGRPPEPADIPRAVALAGRATAVLAGLAGACALACLVLPAACRPRASRWSGGRRGCDASLTAGDTGMAGR